MPHKIKYRGSFMADRFAPITRRDVRQCNLLVRPDFTTADFGEYWDLGDSNYPTRHVLNVNNWCACVCANGLTVTLEV